jgi:peptidoglycan/LPS O-acetylase OafA/YrhL
MLALIRPASNIMINSLSWAPIGYANPLLRLPEFLMGIALGRLFITYGRWRFGGILANTGLFGFLAVIGIGVLGINGFLARTALRFVNVPFLYEALLLVFLALLIYGLAHGRGILAKLLSLPVMLALGEASYAVYILQIPVAAWVKGLTEHRMDPMMMPNIKFFDSLPYFLAYLAILVMVSIISHRAIESPARTAIKRTFGRKGRERTVVDASATPPVPVAPVAAEAGKLS